MRGGIRPNARLHTAARPFIAMLIVLVTVLGVGLTPRASYAAPVPGLPPFCDQQMLLPSQEVTLVCIPPVWNGDLVVYAHGYVDPNAPLALPAELNLFLTNPDGSLIIGPDGNPVLNPQSLPLLVLNSGYAFATTSYSENGYDVEQGAKSIDALVSQVKQAVGGDGHKHHDSKLKRVYLVGTSQGALISTMLVENNPRLYNGGALAMCGPLAGWSYEVQYFGDFPLILNYFFPGLPAMLATAPDDATREGILATAFSNPANQAALRQLFAVTGAAVNPTDSTTAVATAMQVLYYSTPAVLEDLAETAGGNPYDNWRTRYRGSDDDRALNRTIDRIRGDKKAMRYVDRFYTPDGDIRVPVVTLHNLLDPVVPYEQELIYARLVRHEHSSRWLTSIVSTNPYGHCNFTQEETIGALMRLGLQLNIAPPQP